MNRFISRLPIGIKLGGSFIIIVMILAASIMISFSGLGLINGEVDSLYFDHTVPIQDLGEARALVGLIKSNLQLYIQIPQPKIETVDSAGAPKCNTCHSDKVAASSTHYVQTGQSASDAKRCLACHAKQAADTQHGRSTSNMAAGQDCSSCHPADVIMTQHTQVEQSISQEVIRVNQIMASYRNSPNLSSEELTALNTFDTAWKKYQGIVSDLLTKAKNNQAKDALHRIVGGDALASQQELEASINQLVATLQSLAHQAQEKSTTTYTNSTIRLFAAGFLGIILAAALGFLITNNIRTPVIAIASGLDNLRQGNLKWDISDQIRTDMLQRTDELGVAGKGFDSTVVYLQEMASVADKIASGDLTVEVATRGDKDELGISFSKMLASLQLLISMVNESAANLTKASEKLAESSSQSGEASHQIAVTIQQVSQGITQQTEAVTKTATSVEQLSRAIDGVARGAQEQSGAVNKAASVTTRISQAIQQVSNNVQTVTQDSADAANFSRNGTKTVQETIAGMETIRKKVGFSAEKVQEMGTRSEEIGAIVETIEDIASQTNLLALNAAIEAARAGAEGKGFAVVADEVRKLAERSSLATKQIAGLIKGIQKTVDEAVRAMQESAGEVESGVLRANLSGEVLKNILDAVESVYKQAEEAGSSAAKVSAA
ncbi:MAG: methyl-accepting chemotaxis protein, partial [Chloroflexota bacterium]